ncbi:hypothetical protein AAFF_G00369860 [Aldrovandia affinis]|uniref:Uncharacterized protein n=1 Tax=Aldrovandia affinis TaxID=143900 RepID=A0AAD7VYZ4_9TELE|nr:hypothetical protein AAFF_G00369860 [Aldrovandia affinis]
MEWAGPEAGNNLDEYTDTVISFISFCEEVCVPVRTRKIYNNDKPWFTAQLRRLRSEKEEARRSGDKDRFKEAKYRFAKAAKEAKHRFSEKLQQQFSEGNPASVWKGLKTITNYKPKSPQTSDNLSLANELNEFYCRFEKERIKEEEGVRRKGSWCLNTALLIEKEYCEGIRGLVQEGLGCRMAKIDMRVWWDNLKYDIKNYSISYAALRRRRQVWEERSVIEDLEKEYSRNAEGVTGSIDKIMELEGTLEVYKQERCRGAPLRSKAQHVVEGERSTRFFFAMEETRQRARGLEGVTREDGGKVESEEGILREVRDFYAALYRGMVKVLGVYVGVDARAVGLRIWTEVIEGMRKRLQWWAARTLTLQGKVLVINSLMLMKLWYILSVAQFPEWAEKENHLYPIYRQGRPNPNVDITLYQATRQADLVQRNTQSS